MSRYVKRPRPASDDTGIAGALGFGLVFQVGLVVQLALWLVPALQGWRYEELISVLVLVVAASALWLKMRGAG